MSTTLKTWSKATGAFAAVLFSTVMLATAQTAEASTPSQTSLPIEDVAFGEAEVVTLQAGESATSELPDGTTVTLQLGTPEVVSVADVKADSSLSAAQKSELIPMAAAGSIKSNHYSQFTTGVAYTTTHNGTFYYNGARVWVTKTYQGRTGSHNCFLNYAAGVSISTKTCSESGTTSRRDMYYSWEVSAAGISYGASMTAKLYANGTISGFGATVG